MKDALFDVGITTEVAGFKCIQPVPYWGPCPFLAPPLYVSLWYPVPFYVTFQAGRLSPFRFWGETAFKLHLKIWRRKQRKTFYHSHAAHQAF
jgi:hypothetical protein